MNSKRSVEIVGELIGCFLKRKHLFQEEPLWKIGNSPLGGIGVFAAKDIEVGEDVYTDYPIIIGPRTVHCSTPFCIVCFQQNNLNFCPRGCGLPLCSKICEGIHELECEIIRSKREDSREEIDEQLFRYFTPLRALLLNKIDREVVVHLKSHRGDKHGFEVDKLKEMGFKFQNSEADFLELVCCVMDANAFQVVVGNESNCSNVKGLYPLASLLNHSCTPNIMYVFNDKQEMIARASIPVKKGEELFHSYARLIWSTPTRLYHLYRTKNFICRCQRCSDPTEFGTYISAFVCAKCKGNVISKNPLSLKSNWACEDCGTDVDRVEIANLFSMLGSILGSFNNENLNAMLKFLNGKLSNMVSPNHEIIMELKYKVIWTIGYNDNYKIEEIDNTTLEIKATMCKDLLNLVKELKLGDCKLRGLLLYELYSCLKEKSRRKTVSEITSGECEDQGIIERIGKQACRIFRDDVAAPVVLRNLLLKFHS